MNTTINKLDLGTNSIGYAIENESKNIKYTKYKDSGIDWLGDIPSHWEVQRVKNVFKLIAEPAHSNNDFELLSVYTDIGVKPRKELEEKGNKASTTDGYWMVKKGDFIVNKLLAWMGAIGVSDYDGVTSPAYDILRNIKPIQHKFYHELFRNKVFIQEMKKYSKGIMEMRLRLYFDKFGDILIPYPPISEQEAIANFLDEKCAQLDALVSVKEQQIALLKERRQVVIHEAVTKGIQPNVEMPALSGVEMKHSGIDWIGEIPKHWEVVPLKYLTTKIVDGAHFTPTYVDEGIPFLRVTDISKSGIDRKIDWNSVKFIPIQEHKELIKRANPEKGDILLSKNGTIGLTRVIDWNEEFSFFVSLCLIKPIKILSPFYFEFFFNCPLVDRQINDSSSRTSVTNLHLEKIKELLIILPPISEQEAIVSYLEEQTGKIDQAVALKTEQIEKLKAYKQSLINDVVTGKVKVC